MTISFEYKQLDVCYLSGAGCKSREKDIQLIHMLAVINHGDLDEN